MNPYAVVIAAALVFGSGWQVRAWYEGAKDAAVIEAQEETRAKLVELANTVSTSTEEAIKGIRIENRNIYTQAQKEVVRETVYADCKLPANGVLRANQARRGAATGEPDNRLPSARAAGE
jgi:hypothetical protein